MAARSDEGLVVSGIAEGVLTCCLLLNTLSHSASDPCPALVGADMRSDPLGEVGQSATAEDDGMDVDDDDEEGVEEEEVEHAELPILLISAAYDS